MTSRTLEDCGDFDVLIEAIGNIDYWRPWQYSGGYSDLCVSRSKYLVARSRQSTSWLFGCEEYDAEGLGNILAEQVVSDP